MIKIVSAISRKLRLQKSRKKKKLTTDIGSIKGFVNVDMDYNASSFVSVIVI